MNIEQIIFNFLNSSAHNWVNYWKNKEISGITMPGEYVGIRSRFLSKELLREFFEAGFEIETILPGKMDADSYCDILLKRKITD
jgi:hypothetical protein